MNSFKSFSLKKLNEGVSYPEGQKMRGETVYYIGYESTYKPPFYDVDIKSHKLAQKSAFFRIFYLNVSTAFDEHADLVAQLEDNKLKLFKAKADYFGGDISWFTESYADFKGIDYDAAFKEFEKYRKDALNGDTRSEAKKMMKHPITKWLMRYNIDGFTVTHPFSREKYLILLNKIDYNIYSSTVLA